MTGVVLLPPGDGLDELRETVLDLLTEVDSEFVPSLSSREGTTTSALAPGKRRTPVPARYLAEVLLQHALVVQDDGDVLGLMSFVVGREIEALRSYSPCIYLSTIAVRPRYRGRGVGGILYQALVDFLESSAMRHIVTRTWSTNTVHLPLLRRFEFREVLRIVGERGPGVDTVYYARSGPEYQGKREPSST